MPHTAQHYPIYPAKVLPKHVKYGVNYGLTLSVWDYLFGTNHIPEDGRDIELGFDGDELRIERYFNILL